MAVMGFSTPRDIVYGEHALGIPATFKDCAEVDFNEPKFKEVLERMSANAHADPCTLTNPGKPTIADVTRIYEAAYYGRSMK